ncbi:ANTAR domain-containing protein [Mycobacterium lentiflavum]|uniref:ANTAR domain-containing protein n=1 Tax=Mycobacterium lentiflavum TaxID=141349 RepID=A0A0E4GWG4_MYCLN|nr:PAS and ANTAR domain-containing protein [Mycobacterium lentiflavum]CQD09499.1 ANTAR domain-containing protein [Mycobacterium lentiflavum]
MTRRIVSRVDLRPAPRKADDPGDVDGLAALSPQGVGWFRFYFDDQRWEWSEQAQRLYGYEPGAVTPTTELLLSHQHPDDRDQVAATLDAITHTRGALTGRHRIIDTGGVVRWVIVVGDQFSDHHGKPIGTHGFYLDVTPTHHSMHSVEDTITARLGEIADKRAPIEHVKGMLMLVYNLDDNAAFELLSWLSQKSNVKLRVLAEKIGVSLRAAAPSAIVDRNIFDRALMTAHRLAD